MFMGYARASRVDQQDTKAQVAALKVAGVQRIFKDHLVRKMTANQSGGDGSGGCFLDGIEVPRKMGAIQFGLGLYF